MANETFAHCHCLHCKHPLDDVAVQTTICPHCGKELDPEAVWETRSYSGIIILPWWVGLFGWPLLLMVAGAAWSFWWYSAIGHFRRGDPGALVFALGLVWFIVKWAMKGDE